MEQGKEFGHRYDIVLNSINNDGSEINIFSLQNNDGTFGGNTFGSLSPLKLKLTVIYPPEAFPNFIQTVDKPSFRNFTMETRNLFCDVKFKVKGKMIEAHRSALANHSPVFLKMFTSETKDGKQNAVIQIEDEGISHLGFSKFLELIYGFDITLNDPVIGLEIMELAGKYDTQDIKKFVGNEMIASVSRENVIRILIAADMNGSGDLKKAALDFLKKNRLHEMPDFDELAKNADLLKEAIATIY